MSTDNASKNTIGGTAAGAGNVIGGQLNGGIEFGASNSNLVEGNALEIGRAHV